MKSPKKRKSRKASKTTSFSARFEGPIDWTAKGAVLKVSTPDALGIALVEGQQVFRRVVLKFKFHEPTEHGGELCGWIVSVGKEDKSGNPLEIEYQEGIEASKTEAEAEAIFQRINAEVQLYEDQQKQKFKPFAGMNLAERNLHEAQWRVMKEAYPKTIAKLEKQEDASAVFSAEVEGEFRALIERGEKLVWKRIMRAFYARSGIPRLDRVKMELSLHWLDKGYAKMRRGPLSDAIFNATAIRVKPGTLRKIHQRLELWAEIQSGPDTKV